MESTIHVNENYTGVSINVIDPSTPLKYTINGGADKGLFTVQHNPSGDYLHFINAPNYERPSDSNGDNIYELDISVADSFDNTTTQSIRIIVDNVKEGPLLADTNMTVDENAPIGTYIGTMTVINEGDGNLTEFYSSNEDLMIDNEGKIYTRTIFDYERIPEYSVGIGARNDVGASATAKNVYLKINDIAEPIPEVHPFTGSMDDHAPEGKVVGQLYVYPGLDASAEVRLIGEGAGDFDVNASGHITVSAIANLNHEVQKQYNLKAIASNSFGDSEEANVTIYINVWMKQIGTPFDDYPEVITVDFESNFYVEGWLSKNTLNKRRFVRKYNDAGELQWNYEINQSEKLEISSIVVNKNGTVFVLGSKATGRTYVSNYGYTNDVYVAWIMAISSEQLWLHK